MKKSIILIEDDADGTSVVLSAPTEELLRKDADALWEEFSQYRNPGFSDPNPPGVAEFSEDGGLACSFDVSYSKSTFQSVCNWPKPNLRQIDRAANDRYFGVAATEIEAAVGKGA